MAIHDLILVLISFFSEILGTVSGFGSSSYFVPIALFFEKFTFVITITAFLHTISNCFRIFTFRQGYDKKLLVRLAIPSVIFCVLGALCVSYINQKLAERILGILLILFSLMRLMIPQQRWEIGKEKALFLGGLSGFLTGLVGSGGALRGIILSSLYVSKESFVFLSSAIDIGGDALRLLIYLRNGYMEWNQWYYIPLLVIAGAFGIKAGKKILDKVSQPLFEKIVMLFTLLSGIALLGVSFS